MSKDAAGWRVDSGSGLMVPHTICYQHDFIMNGSMSTMDETPILYLFCSYLESTGALFKRRFAHWGVEDAVYVLGEASH